MAQFRTDKENIKWNSLQDHSGTTINKVLKGVATSANLKSLASSLHSLDPLAGKLFDSFITASNITAHSVADSTKHHIDEILNRILSQQFPEVLRQIKSILQSSTSQIESKLPPKDLPTVDDLLASNELLLEKIQEQDDALYDRITAMVSDSFTKAVTGLKVKIRFSDIEPQQKQSIYDKALSLLGNPPPASQSSTQVLANLPPSNTNNQIIRSRVSSMGKNSHEKFYARIEQLFRSSLSDIMESSKYSKAEEKKANIWWKAFKYTASGIIKAPSKLTDLIPGGWLTLIGGTLLSMLLTPQLWKTMGSLIQKYVTWNNITGIVKKAWDFVKTESQSAIDYVWNKLLTLKNVEAVGTWIENVADKLWSKLVHTPKSLLPSNMQGITQLVTPTDEKMVHGWWNNFVNWASKFTGTKFQETSTNNLVLSSSPSSSISNFVNAATKTNTSRTISVSANNINYGNKGTLISPNTNQQPNNIQQTQVTTTAASTTRIGIHSFGISSAVDDNLILMNSSFWGH
jgi:hypothetical protein